VITAGKSLRALVSEKIVQLNKKLFISLSVVSICFILDRLSKIYIINFFINNPAQDYFVNSYTNFILIWNKGIAFGLLQSENLFYHLVSFIIFCIILLIIYIIIKSDKFLEIFCYSMIIGGALGNLFDRLYYNAVPDFIDLHYRDFHWFTFNVSDICISVAIVLLFSIDLIKFKKKEIDDE